MCLCVCCFFSFIWTSTIFLYSTWRFQRRGLLPLVLPDPFLLVTSDSRPLLCHEFECPSTLPHHLVKLLGSFVSYSLFFEPYKGKKVFSWVACITYMERRIRYTISGSKLACGIEQGEGGGWGIGATNGIWWYPKRLNSPLSLLAHIKSIFIKRKQKTFFHSFFFFKLAKEANGSNFEPKFLVRIPKVSQHDVDDRNLIDFGSVNLHHSLSVALPRLQKRHTKEYRAAN